MKNSQKLGDITLYFNKHGRYTGSIFKGCQFDELPKIENIHSGADAGRILETTKRMFSNLFTLVNKVELADREKYIVSSVLQSVERNESGIITKMTVSFSLEEL